MKYYKKDSQVFAFEADGSQDDYITDDMVLMTDAEVEAHLQPAPTVDVLPPLTRRQFKLALLHAGLTDSIEQAIDSIPDPTTRAVVRIEFEETTLFERDAASVVFMVDLLALSEDDINEIWKNAAVL